MGFPIAPGWAALVAGRMLELLVNKEMPNSEQGWR